MLKKVDDCVTNNESFAIETTLSGRSYLSKVKKWQHLGYQVFLFYFSLPSVNMAIERVKYRVSVGGHNIPKPTIERRFERSLINLREFQQVVDGWVLFDSSGWEPKLQKAHNYDK